MHGSCSRLLSVARPSTMPELWKPGPLRSKLLFIRELGKGTGDPLWILLDRLRRRKFLPLSEALFRNKTSYEEFQPWKKVLAAADIDQAMLVIAKTKPWIAQSTQSLTKHEHIHEVDHRDDETLIRRFPTWLVFYLVSYKVRTSAQASGALLDLVFNQLPLVPPRFQPSLITIVALSLAKYSLLVPMRRVINVFLTIPVDHPTLHFNLLLQAVGRLPKSTEAADLAVIVMEAMTSREIRLASRTYHTLLADRFVTLQLTKLLQSKMVQEKFIPSHRHFEAFVRVFSKHGAIHDADSYLKTIRSYKSQGGNPYIPYVPNLEDDDGVGTSQKANTAYMRMFGHDRVSAFEYLRRLLNASQDPEAKHVIKPTTSALYLRVGKKAMNIFDWTTAFSCAARQWRTSSEQLIRLFDSTIKTRHFRPTVATYTVLLRGLIMRHDYVDAERVWDRLIADRLVLDVKALGAGVKALTLAEMPMKAFRVLEEFSVRPGMIPPSRGEVRQAPHPWQKISSCHPERRVQISTMTMSDFMIALLRIQRPDVVFKLWDYMEMLYNVKPNSHSLETLCRAARLSAKLDSQSLAGNIAMMGLSNPFRKLQAEPSNREEVVETIERMLNEKSSAGVARNIWKNAPAADGVRNAFQGIIFGNWPELRDIKSPANPVRRTAEGTELSPFREVAQSIALSLSSTSIQQLREPHPHLTFSPSIYGTVVPSEAAFSAYILVLGTSDYQHEIPLVLAWMRALRIHPRRRTLCFALIFWAEVSLRGPMFEDWAEKNGRSEYGRLHRWITDWVGEMNVPQDYMIAHFLKVVAQARDSKVVAQARDSSPRTKRDRRQRIIT